MDALPAGTEPNTTHWEDDNMKGMFARYCAAAACLLLMAQVCAIGGTADWFTITDNGWSYTEYNLKNFRTNPNAGLANWKFGTGPDNLTQNWWWYRTLDDTREYAMSNQVQIVQGVNIVEMVYYESLANGLIPNALEMRLRYTLTGISPTAAKVTINWEARNISQYATPFDFFAYLDPDWGVQTVGSLQSFSPLVGKILLDDLAGDRQLLLTAQPDHLACWEIAASNSTIGKLSDGNVNNLSNTVTPLGPTSATAALQWRFDLQPYQLAKGTLTKEICLPEQEEIIPEAGSLALALPGLGMLALLRRRVRD